MYMSWVFLGTNFYIISFLGIWGTKGGYWETGKFKLPKNRHCGLTTAVPCCVLLLSYPVSVVLFMLFAFLLFDVLGLAAPFPWVSPFLYHAVPGSQNTLLQRGPLPWAFSSFSKTRVLQGQYQLQCTADFKLNNPAFLSGHLHSQENVISPPQC